MVHHISLAHNCSPTTLYSVRKSLLLLWAKQINEARKKATP